MSKPVRIDECSVGPGSPCFIIAEAGENPVGNLEAAKEIVRQAKLCGIDAIKFQHHIAAEEMVRDDEMLKGMVVTLPSHNISLPLYEYLEQHTFNMEDHRVICVLA